MQSMLYKQEVHNLQHMCAVRRSFIAQCAEINRKLDNLRTELLLVQDQSTEACMFLRCKQLMAQRTQVILQTAEVVDQIIDSLSVVCNLREQMKNNAR